MPYSSARRRVAGAPWSALLGAAAMLSLSLAPVAVAASNHQDGRSDSVHAVDVSGQDGSGSTQARSLPGSTLDITEGVDLTVTDTGAIGWFDPQAGAAQGLGFQLQGEAIRQLKHAGVVLGVSPTEVSDAAYGSDDNGGSIPFDFTATSPMSWITLASGGPATWAVYSDSTIGVTVSQVVWAPDTAPYALVDLLVTADQAVTGLHAGLFSDWNLENELLHNVGTGDIPGAGQFAYVFDPNNPAYEWYGTAVLADSSSTARAIYNADVIDDARLQVPWSPERVQRLYFVDDSALKRIGTVNFPAPVETMGDANLMYGIDIAINESAQRTYGTDGDVWFLDGSPAEEGLWVGNQVAVDPVTNGLYLGRFAQEISREQTSPTQLVSDRIGRHVAVDAVNSRIYWTDGMSVRRSNLDGTHIRVLAAGGDALFGGTYGIALDVAGGKVYWTDRGTSGIGESIWRADLDGANAEPLLAGIGVSRDLGDLDLDLVNRKMYWTKPASHMILRANLDGTAVDTLATFSSMSSPDGIALDAAGLKMYWTDSSTSPSDAGIFWANLDGTGMQVLVTGVAPTGIALDPVAAKMYWTDEVASNLRRANLDGTQQEDLVSTTGPLGVGLDLSGKMYWTDWVYNELSRANIDGTAVETLLEWTYVGDLQVSAATGRMYWSSPGEDVIYQATLDGDSVAVLIDKLETTKRGRTGIAIDAANDHIYYTDVTGSVMRVRRTNLSSQDVTVNMATFAADGTGGQIVLDLVTRKLYVTGLGDIWKSPLDGTPAFTQHVDGIDIETIAGIGMDLPNPWETWRKVVVANATSIYTTELDGTSPTPINVGSTFGTGPVAVLPDPRFYNDGHGNYGWPVYFTEAGTGAADGRVATTDLTGKAVTNFAAGRVTPGSLAMDVDKDRVYWAESGAIARRKVSGVPSTVEVQYSGPVEPFGGLALDSWQARLYWREGGSIKSGGLDGTNVTTVVSAVADAGTEGSPRSLVVDVLGQKLWWSDAGDILRANLDGTGQETMVGGDEVTTLAIQDPIAGVTPSRTLYWLTSGSSDIPAELKSASLDNQGNLGAAVVLVDNAFRGAPDNPRCIAVYQGAEWGFEDNEKFAFLQGGGPRVGDRSDDWSTMVSSGPVDLQAGESARFAFVMAGLPSGGARAAMADSAGFAALLAQAQTQWETDAPSHPAGGETVGAPSLTEAPAAFRLHPSFPNPFARTTAIAYELPRSATVDLRVFDVGGRLVRTLERATKDAGRYQALWDGRDDSGDPVATGVYLYRLDAGEFRQTRKLVHVR